VGARAGVRVGARTGVRAGVRLRARAEARAGVRAGVRARGRGRVGLAPPGSTLIRLTEAGERSRRHNVRSYGTWLG